MRHGFKQQLVNADFTMEIGYKTMLPILWLTNMLKHLTYYLRN